jgi:hypothetical protein
MANLSNINNKFLVTTGGNVLIGQTSAVGSPILQVDGGATFMGSVSIGTTGAVTDRRFEVTSGTYSSLTATTNQYGVVINPTYASNITNSIYNLYNGPALASGTTLTNLYNLYLEANGVSGSTVTNSYGVYQSGGGDKNYFAGKVGIGNTNPTYQLDVLGTGSYGGMIQMENTTANAYPRLAIQSDVKGYHIGVGGSGAGAGYANNLYFYDNNEAAVRMVIDTGGNVGIGTDSPSATTKLHIRNATSNSYATLRLEGSNRGGIIQMYNQTSYPVSSIQTDQSGNTYFSTSGAFASTTLSAKMSILTTGELIQGNNTNGIIPGTSLLRLANTGIYGAGQTGPYGTYGGMIFNSSANYTGGARRYMITNGYLGTSLAFIRSANYNTDPSISGDDGTVSSGSVSYYIASTGYNIFPEYVGMGTTAPTSQLFVNNTVDGDKIRWGRSDALVGSVGTYNGVPYIGYQGGAGGGIMFNGSSIEPTALGSTRSSSTNDIGSNSYKWRNIYLSGGAYLGGTGSANHLDYYEEGSWTPVISHHDGSGVIPSTNSGSRYTRIGGMVHLQAYITAINPAGNAGTSSPYYGIRGFPFAPTSITTWEMVYVPSSITSYGGYGSAASMYFLSLNSNGTNGAGHISGTVVNSWGANVYLMMSITYAIH